MPSDWVERWERMNEEGEYDDMKEVEGALEHFISWREWERKEMEKQSAEARKCGTNVEHPKVATGRFASARDNYGWKSLPHGTKYFGPQKEGK